MAVQTGDILQARWEYSYQSQTYMTMAAFQYEGAGTGLDPLATALAVATWMGGGVAGNTLLFDLLTSLIPTNVVIERTVAQWVYSTRYVPQAYVVGTSGEYGGTCSTGNISGVLTKQSTFSGRRFVGSLHIPCLPSLAHANGLIVQNYKNAMVNFAVEYKRTYALPGAAGNNFVPIIMPKNPGALAPAKIASIYPQPQVRVMRRRTVGLGI